MSLNHHQRLSSQSYHGIKTNHLDLSSIIITCHHIGIRLRIRTNQNTLTRIRYIRNNICIGNPTTITNRLRCTQTPVLTITVVSLISRVSIAKRSVIASNCLKILILTGIRCNHYIHFHPHLLP